MVSEKSVYDKIWETRKARINTEQRLLRYLNISDWLIPLYSAALIVIYLLPNIDNNQCLSIFTIFLSIVILIASIILNSKQFGIRALKMKAHYIELDKLFFKIKSDDENIANYYFEYNTLLNQVENHSRMDYLKLAIELKKNPNSTVNKPTWRDEVYYYFRIIAFYSFIACLFALPIISIIVLLI